MAFEYPFLHYHLNDTTKEWDGGDPVAAWICDGILPSLFSVPHCYKLLGEFVPLNMSLPNSYSEVLISLLPLPQRG